MSKVLVKKGRVVDPSQDLDIVRDVLIEDGVIKSVREDILEHDAQIIDARGKVVCPSFVDLHVHLRDPGQTYKEDIESGSRCAVAGGYTYMVCMPNTKPPIDRPEIVEYIKSKAEKVGLCCIIPSGAITKDREGRELTDFFALKMSGCLVLTDDGSPLMDSRLMKKALELAGQLGLLIMNHCEDDRLAYGHINDGYVSSLLGISPRPKSAEDVLVARDCILSYYTDSPLHIQHVSSPMTLDMIRYFKSKGAKVSCEINPYHLLFTEKEVLEMGPNAKINPPLRSQKDRQAFLEALKDGTIDCVATDHAPHAPWEKGQIESAMPGMIGLQTALPAMLELVTEGIIDLSRMVELMSLNPAKLLGLEGGIKEGSLANLVIFDPNREWVLNKSTNLSKSKNTPLWNRKLKGKVLYTFFKGRVVYQDV
ncbi:MAG: dihydroorotase [Aquificaceae bacterium]